MEEKIKVITDSMKANDQLFYKMQKDLDTFINDVKTFFPEEMLSMEPEIKTKRNILKYFDSKDISGMAAKGFLKLDYPLDFLYSALMRKLFEPKNLPRFVEQCGRALYEGFDYPVYR